MPRKLRGTTKEEIRVLALEPTGSNELLGVVYRGKYWLDGVFRIKLDRLSATSLSGVLRRIRYYPEIRLLIVDHNLRIRDLQTLERELNLPVIVIGSGGRIIEAYGIESEEAFRIVKKLSVQGVPEALRVARLLALSLRSIGTRIM